MKIVNREEFLKLPPFTLYRQGNRQWSFGEMQFKYDTWDNDWVCQALDGPEFEAGSGGEIYERMEAMFNGASFPLEVDFAGRDGLFEPDAYFMIYEKDDLVLLRAEIDKAIAAAPEPPERPADYRRPPDE